MLIFIRFFIFAGPPQDKRDYQSHIRQQRQAKLLPDEKATATTILEKTYYDVNSHPPESLDWFTVLLAQAVAHLRDDAHQYGNLLHAISEALNSDKIPSYVGTIKVTELNIGNDFPIFNNCRVITRKSNVNAPKQATSQLDTTKTANTNGVAADTVSAGANGDNTMSKSEPGTHKIRGSQSNRSNGSNNLDSQVVRRANSRKSLGGGGKSNNINTADIEDDDTLLELLLDVDLSDNITLGVDTELLINFPRPCFATLPVSLVVSVVHFSGTLKIALHQPESPDSQELEEDSETPIKGPDNPTSSTMSDDDEGTAQLLNETGNIHDHDINISEADVGPSNQDPNSANVEHEEISSKPSDTKTKHRPYITVSFDQFPTIEFEIKSSIGSNSKLRDVPKISQLVGTQLHKAVRSNLVYPNERKVFLPQVLPEPEDLASSDKSKASTSTGSPVPASTTSASVSATAPAVASSPASTPAFASASVPGTASISTSATVSSTSAPIPSASAFVSASASTSASPSTMKQSTGYQSTVSSGSAGNASTHLQEHDESGANSHSTANSNQSNGSVNNGNSQEETHFMTPRLHPRSFSSVSQLASNTAINLPSFRALSPEQDDFSAVI